MIFKRTNEREKEHDRMRDRMRVYSTEWTMRVIYISEIGEQRLPIIPESRYLCRIARIRLLVFAGSVPSRSTVGRLFDILEHTVRFIYRVTVLPCSSVHELLIRMPIVADWLLNFHTIDLLIPKMCKINLCARPVEMRDANRKTEICVAKSRLYIENGPFL